MATAIYSMKIKSWHLIEKLFLLKATCIFALMKPNNLKALKDLTKFSWSCITPFPPSGSRHRASTSQVYKIKKSNHSEPNYICCRFSVVSLLIYAHFQNKIKIIWNLFKHRDLLILFFNVIQDRKCIFLCQVLRWSLCLHFFPHVMSKVNTFSESISCFMLSSSEIPTLFESFPMHTNLCIAC